MAPTSSGLGHRSAQAIRNSSSATNYDAPRVSASALTGAPVIQHKVAHSDPERKPPHPATSPDCSPVVPNQIRAPITANTFTVRFIIGCECGPLERDRVRLSKHLAAASQVLQFIPARPSSHKKFVLAEPALLCSYNDSKW
ncbi:hypothetical protein P8C59_005605 [Phyllachora maydis]|uniref:Uncharacterized protein n=1 Tax=Phyllachora maydis TaxID=1825666 RepID=A0AAD9I6B3_9PEZI|nr:hypothetical protein P8C59_005605 [Phyllachora maydis]